MMLKEYIERIFQIKTGYAAPEHAIDQAESLKSLSIDLYTDPKRFVYELLQNADDSAIHNSLVKVGIRLFDDFLVVAHTGKPFDNRDLRGICGVNDGTKKNSIEKTGYKGIGFKAVFGQSQKVTIYSDGEYFRFDSGYSFSWNPDWGNNQGEWEKENERKFLFPWQIIPIYTRDKEIDYRIQRFLEDGEWTVATIVMLSKGKDDVKEAVRQLSSNVNMFLFLKNIERLDFNLGTPNVLTLYREQSGKSVEVKQNGQLKASWLLKTVSLEVPDDIKLKLIEERNIPKKLLNSDKTELTFAAKIGQDGIQKLEVNEQLLYSYLPTEETKYAIPVLVNSSFVIGANRETLHEDSKWNQWLFKNIPLELLKWIAELVKIEFGYQAYELIPSKSSFSNTLGLAYNSGLSNALETVPFILSNQNDLIRTNQAIIDFTSISKRPFISENVVRSFVIRKYGKETIHTNPFLPYTGFGNKLKSIGVACFEWGDVSNLMESDVFLNNHSSSRNIQLISYLKQLSEAEKPKKITDAVIKKWVFILDHKNALHHPANIYFPTPDDKSWNDPNSEISFLHKDVQQYLLTKPELRAWLEQLGVIEKTDLSYLRKTITENAATYSTLENSVPTILNIFSLYLKGDIGKEILGELSELKILTKKGTLLPAKSCYLSDGYAPRLKLENVLSDDVFVSPEYMKESSEDKEEWKRFFKMMRVKEGISLTTHNKRSKYELIQQNKFESNFFEEDDKKFWSGKFEADEFSGLTNLLFLSKTIDCSFSNHFWYDVIENLDLNVINEAATAYWGYSNRQGRLTGVSIDNYLSWYINQYKCIPTTMGTCMKAKKVFLNSDDIKKIGGERYLPIFFGPELSPNWRSFFGFKTSLKLVDYLELLEKIASDVNENDKIEKDNFNRVQSIYYALLESCVNWSEAEILQVQEWSKTAHLLNTKLRFTECKTLKYFLDGNNSIFQEQFYFIKISAENKKHPNLEVLLNHLNIKVLKQSDFELDYTEKEDCSNLISHLKIVIPYFKIWIEHETENDRKSDVLENLQDKIESLNIYQTEELKIKYSDIDFIKNVNVHFNKPNLFVTNPWDANSVLLKLSEILCRYFYLIGHDKKLDFLLRSNYKEIQNYFAQEDINIPEDIVFDFEDNDKPIQPKSFDSFAEIDNANRKGKISSDFFHLSKSEYESFRYVEKLIPRAVTNIKKYLNSHPEYDCQNSYEIAPSIIGGITKNGNEITVIARPSDDEKVILYYTSEFDVLEYVDAEFWYEDGINLPKQITLGQLFKKTGINKIPVKNIDISVSEIDSFLNTPKSETFDFNPVPFVPQKIAKIISAFANTNGGSLIFGLKETSSTTNEIVGLSADFRVVEIAKKAISLLSPIPSVTFGWVECGEKSVFAIKTEKADSDILFNEQKYIRKEAETVLEANSLENTKILSVPDFNRTIAIIIGIEEYLPRNQILPVKYANADTLKFKELLIQNMDVNEEEVLLLTNEDANENTIKYELNRLFPYLTENDRLIFYYVGHGFHNGVTNYLSTYNTHKFNITETSMSLSKMLFEPLKKSKCKTALIFIDACAQSFRNENERSLITDINDEEFKLLNNEFPYYGIFLSCNSGQSSYSSDTLKNGIWTHHLVEALSGHIPEVIRDNKYITDIKLRDYLSTKVAEYTKQELGYEQNPKAILDASNENIIAQTKI